MRYEWGEDALTWIFTLIDDAIPIALVLWAATALGVGFGALGSTLLKFGAIIVLIVSGVLWLPAVLKATGAMSASGQAPMLYVIFLNYCLATTFMAIACMYLFRMDINDVAMFAIIYLVIGVIFDLAVAVVVLAVVGMAHPRATASTPPATPAPAVALSTASPPPVANPGPAAIVPTFLDKIILRRIHEQPPVQQVFAGNQWKQSNRYTAADKRIDGWIDQMYAAGAVNVYIDTNGGLHTLAYVELPPDADKRAACAKAASDYRDNIGLRPESPAVARLMGQFLIVSLKK